MEQLFPQWVPCTPPSNGVNKPRLFSCLDFMNDRMYERMRTPPSFIEEAIKQITLKCVKKPISDKSADQHGLQLSCQEISRLNASLMCYEGFWGCLVESQQLPLRHISPTICKSARVVSILVRVYLERTCNVGFVAIRQIEELSISSRVHSV